MCLIIFAYNCHPVYRLILGANRDELHYFTNRGGSSGPVTPGIHALSNHLLDTRWPKATVAKSRLEAIVQQADIDPEQIFAAMSDPATFASSLRTSTTERFSFQIHSQNHPHIR